MERHLKDAEPRWALVVWPEISTYAELPCCVSITDAAVAVTHGAVIVGIEDAEFCKPRQRVLPDPIVLRLRFNHPYRFDANWQSRPKDMPDDNGANEKDDD